jgi:hypothetical protein
MRKNLMTYVHSNRNNHKLRVEAHKRLVFCKTDLINKSDLDDTQEIPVKAGIHNKDEDLRDLVPDFVDLDEGLTDRG